MTGLALPPQHVRDLFRRGEHGETAVAFLPAEALPVLRIVLGHGHDVEYLRVAAQARHFPFGMVVNHADLSYPYHKIVLPGRQPTTPERSTDSTKKRCITKNSKTSGAIVSSSAVERRS